MFDAGARYDKIGKSIPYNRAFSMQDRSRCALKGADCKREIFTTDAVAMIHETALGSLRDIDRVATAALRASARRKRKLVERDVVDHVINVLGV